MSPSDSPGWGGARPGAGRPRKSETERYSISRAIAQVVGHQSVDGFEGELSRELELTNRVSPAIKAIQIGGVGASLTVPWEALDTRVVSVSPPGTGAALFGEPVREGLGLLQWSAVANSGATIIENLRENISIYHTSPIPEARWTAEAGLVVDSDPLFAASGATPHRIAACVILTAQLSLQTGRGADELISRQISRAIAAMIDRTSLYGLGNGIEPRGILHTAGANDMPIGSGPWWDHLGFMRRACIDGDAEVDSYGIIIPPAAEQHFNQTSAFPSGGIPILATLPWPYQVSNQIGDNRVFSGAWVYETLLFWGAGVDLIVDAITQMRNGLIVITASVYCDTVCRFPSAFAFSEEDSVTPPPFTFTSGAAVKAKGGKGGKPSEGPFR